MGRTFALHQPTNKKINNGELEMFGRRKPKFDLLDITSDETYDILLDDLIEDLRDIKQKGRRPCIICISAGKEPGIGTKAVALKSNAVIINQTMKYLKELLQNGKKGR